MKRKSTGTEEVSIEDVKGVEIISVAEDKVRADEEKNIEAQIHVLR